jgi:hypothetical protein
MHVTDWFATAAAALESAQEADDPRAQAAAHLGLAGLRWRARTATATRPTTLGGR